MVEVIEEPSQSGRSWPLSSSRSAKDTEGQPPPPPAWRAVSTRRRAVRRAVDVSVEQQQAQSARELRERIIRTAARARAVVPALARTLAGAQRATEESTLARLAASSFITPPAQPPP